MDMLRGLRRAGGRHLRGRFALAIVLVLAYVLGAAGLESARAGDSDRGDPDRLNLLLAQSSSGASSLNNSEPPPYYKIGPQDFLTILVRNNPDLSTGVVVRPDGRLSIPLVEDLEVAGLTATELSRKLEELLSEYVQDPIVTVIINSFAGLYSEQIRIVGEVIQPQSIPYRTGMTVLDVLIASGGLSPYADGNKAKIIRRQGDATQEIPVRLNDLVDLGITSANVAMEPGDILVIPEGFFSGDWFVTKSIAWRETFTDNVNLEPDGDPAIITTIIPRISAVLNSAKVQAAFDVAVPLRYQAINDEKFEVDIDLSAVSTTELAENRAFLDANASVSQQALNNEAATSVSPDNQQNLNTVATIFVSPYVVGRYEDVATYEARYSVGTFYTDDDGVSNALANRFALTANGGTMFSRLNWLTGLTGSCRDLIPTEGSSPGRALRSAPFACLGFQVA